MKKRAMLVALMATATAGFAQMPVADELKAKSRLASAADVAGEWAMVYQVVRADLPKDSLFFAEHQVLVYDAGGYVKNLTSTKAMSEEDMAAYLNAMPKKTRYSFEADGVMRVVRAESDKDRILISVMTEDMAQPLRDGAPLLKKGEMLLSYTDPSGAAYMQRVLRKTDIPGVTP